MTGELLDISWPLSRRTACWPDSPGVDLGLLKSLAAGDEADVTLLSLEIHTGTHIDAPAHMIAGEPSMDGYELETGLGEALVVDARGVPALDARALADLSIPVGERRVLFRTDNSERSPEGDFTSDYVGFTLDGAEWLVERGIGLAGIDYLSIQRFGDPLDTHLVLFRGGVTILEGLHLAAVEPGRYELICMPMSLPGAEAAPARAVLRTLPAAT